jgi:hypothetical protein
MKVQTPEDMRIEELEKEVARLEERVDFLVDDRAALVRNACARDERIVELEAVTRACLKMLRKLPAHRRTPECSDMIEKLKRVSAGTGD